MKVRVNITTCAAVLILLCTMLSTAARAQDRHSASLLYGITFPTGNGFIDKTGFADLSVEYSLRLTPVFTAGISLSYGYVRQKGHTNDRYNGDLVSGFSDRNLLVVPVMVQLHCFPWRQQTRWQPYIIIGAGTQYARFNIVGDQIDKRATDNLAMVFSSQIGARFFPIDGGKFYLDGRISWRYGSNKWEIMNVKSIQQAGIILGAGIMF